MILVGLTGWQYKPIAAALLHRHETTFASSGLRFLSSGILTLSRQPSSECTFPFSTNGCSPTFRLHKIDYFCIVTYSACTSFYPIYATSPFIRSHFPHGLVFV